MTKLLELGTFRDYLNTYGANLERWPEDLRSVAEDTLKHNEQARKLYIEALKLDHLFDNSKDSAAPDGLLEKILRNTD
jgi:hypothetical protein